MVTLTNGQFFGQTNSRTNLGGVTLTDTEYTHDRVNWHYHENAYFTLLLEGHVIEGNKKEIYHCPAGTLLFHNWQEAHYNIKPNGFTRGFHIEIDEGWINTQEVRLKLSEGSINISHPQIKIRAYHIFKEFKMADTTSHLAIDSLLVDVLSGMSDIQEKRHRAIPEWAVTLRDILNDAPKEEWTLICLAKMLNIHPVHLSRNFSKYFGCNLGDYIRIIKVQNAFSLLANKNLSLTDITYSCGFADQSHFIRCFKAVNHVKPSQFRRFFKK